MPATPRSERRKASMDARVGFASRSDEVIVPLEMVDEDVAVSGNDRMIGKWMERIGFSDEGSAIII